jgi:hypothetical protein
MVVAGPSQPILGVQDRDGQGGRQGQVHEGDGHGQDAQQPVPEQPAHPLADLGAQAGRGLALGPLDPEPAAHGRDQGGRGREGPGVEQERDRGGGGEQPPAQGRGDQLVGHHLGAKQAAVGPGQPVLGHHGGQDRDGRVVEQGLGRAEGEEDRVQQGQGGGVGEHGHPEQADGDTAGGVDPDHQPAAVQPVDQGPADQREQQPGEPLGDGQAGDQPRVAGQGGGQQRPGDQGDAVAQVGDGVGRPQSGEVGPEAARAQVGSLCLGGTGLTIRRSSGRPEGTRQHL